MQTGKKASCQDRIGATRQRPSTWVSAIFNCSGLILASFLSTLNHDLPLSLCPRVGVTNTPPPDMGLAAPRKRTKLSHDPRNTAWQASPSASFGHRLMSSQGWKPGDALGSTSSTHHTSSSDGVQRKEDRRNLESGRNSGNAQSRDVGENDKQRAEENKARLAAAHVGVLFKDDTLGLGAKAGATDVEARSAGLDAFVGLLGRLNAKDQEEVEAVERVHKRKVGDGVLERYARGKGWGMVFVRGGSVEGRGGVWDREGAGGV